MVSSVGSLPSQLTAVDTADDMLAQGLDVSVACTYTLVFVGVLACVRARVTVVCSYNHRLCVIDIISNFRTFFSLATSVFFIRFSLTIPN